MKSVLIETPISAPVELIWDVLTDLPRYGEWNPFITSIEGDLSDQASGAEGDVPAAGTEAAHLHPDGDGRGPVTGGSPGSAGSGSPGWWTRRTASRIANGTEGPVFVHREDFRGVLVPCSASSSGTRTPCSGPRPVCSRRPVR